MIWWDASTIVLYEEYIMSKLIRIITAILLVASIVSATTDTSAADKAGPIKVVILVGGHGYDQKNFDKAWGGHDDITCEVSKQKPYTLFDDISAFNYDVILMYNLSSGITDKQKENFLALLKKGVGLVVWHHSMANCQNWPEFEKIAGCKYWMKAGEKNGKLEVFVELRDANYPGSNYRLIYDPVHDLLRGVYFQAVAKQSYDVTFRRMPST